jgi:hypothetical protein
MPINIPIPHPIIEITEASREAQAEACPHLFLGVEVSSAMPVVQRAAKHIDNTILFKQAPFLG